MNKDIYLSNSLGGKKEKFVPIKEDKVGMYVCGPTVYDDPHIGNARPLVIFDLLFKVLKCKYGNKAVTYVRNITDIDDKIIKSSKEKKIPISDLTKSITKNFHTDCEYLICEVPSYEPRATENIKLMIEMINDLIKNDFAYESEKHIYFKVKNFKDYGKLSNKNLEDLIAGSRVEVSENKKNPEDFVLWKPSKDDEPFWESPWGKGRPGWHLECSVMSKKYLGDTFDIHGGGRDLIFPHHENEIAQGSCCSNAKYCNYWFHNGIVLVNKKKMSKSLGNVILVSDIITKHDPIVVRLALMSTHYRQPLNWTDNTITNSKNILDKIYRVLDTYKGTSVERDNNFIGLLCDDINTPNAIQYLVRQAKESKNKQSNIPKLRYNCRLLGLNKNNLEITVSEKDRILIENLISKRDEARNNKDFDRADLIRNQLESMNVELEDSADGVTWKIKP